MKFLVIISISFLSISNLLAQNVINKNVKYNPVISEFVPSLISEDHTAEGFLVTLSTGRIVHIFRLDPGQEGHHVGNAGRIVRRYTDDGGLTWSQNYTIYNSQYDDRNVAGGLVQNDRIVVFFRRYEAVTVQTIDLLFMYSDDGGDSWSDTVKINTVAHGPGPHQLIEVPGKGFMAIFYDSYYVEIRYSQDGTRWDEIDYRWDYRANYSHNITECSFAYVGNGRIVGLTRDNNYAWGSHPYQFSTTDYGTEWSNPMKTNLADSFFCAAPLVFYDNMHNDLWTIVTDRRSHCGPQYQNKDSEIWIYRNNPDEVIDNPMNYKLFTKRLRPQPNFYRLYGYPIFTKKLDGNYLVIFTESSRKVNYKEQADFWQFEIKYEESTYAYSDLDFYGEILSQNYPNPVTQSSTIDFYVDSEENLKDLSISFYDLKGRLVKKYENIDFVLGMNSLLIEATDFDNGLYVYVLKYGRIEEKRKMVVLKS